MFVEEEMTDRVELECLDGLGGGELGEGFFGVELCAMEGEQKLDQFSRT